MKTWQTYVSGAAIQALDQAAERLGDAGKDADRLVHRLAGQWRKLDDKEKRELAEIVVAIGGAVTMAVAAFSDRGSKKKKAKEKAKKLVKKTGKAAIKHIAKKL
jgi:hypothetical protein